MVVGVASWTQPCGEDGYPGIYMRVSYFSDWIKGHMER